MSMPPIMNDCPAWEVMVSEVGLAQAGAPLVGAGVRLSEEYKIIFILMPTAIHCCIRLKYLREILLTLI